MLIKFDAGRQSTWAKVSGTLLYRFGSICFTDMSSPQQLSHSSQSESVLSSNSLHSGEFDGSSISRYQTLEHGEPLVYHNDKPNVAKFNRTSPSTLNSSRCIDYIIGKPNGNIMRAGNIIKLSGLPDYTTVPDLMRSKSLNDQEKLAILSQYPHYVLDRLYEQHIGAHSLLQPPVAGNLQPKPDDLNEKNYLPLNEDAVSSVNLESHQTIYPAYFGHFQTAQDAKAYRKRTRIVPKSHASDVERVKRYGRKYFTADCISIPR